MAVSTENSGNVSGGRRERSSHEVSPPRLLVRCFAEKKGGQWQAFSLEFGLAVQGDSKAEVKAKLDSVIESYLRDALVGEDREHAYELLSRKATWPVYVKYYLIKTILLVTTSTSAGTDRLAYREPWPLEPRHC